MNKKMENPLELQIEHAKSIYLAKEPFHSLSDIFDVYIKSILEDKIYDRDQRDYLREHLAQFLKDISLCKK
jgi:hypothetical protein